MEFFTLRKARSLLLRRDVGKALSVSRVGRRVYLNTESGDVVSVLVLHVVSDLRWMLQKGGWSPPITPWVQFSAFVYSYR